jgi:SAM-dependent methyltransferase
MKTNNERGWYPSPRYLFRKNVIIRYLKKQHLQSKTLLEIGYGAGDMLITYNQLGLKVAGYDFSEMAYQEALNRIQKKGITDIKLLKDKNELKLEKFDFVIACEVLEHMEEDGKTLSEWAEYLKPGGLLIISVPAKMSKWGVSDQWAGHYRRYERTEITDKLREHGFYSIKVLSYLFPFNIVLDRLLNKEKKDLIVEKNLNVNDKKASSEASGIIRKSNRLFRFVSNPVFLTPCFVIQRTFFRMDLGSGYICYAIKKGEPPAFDV